MKGSIKNIKSYDEKDELSEKDKYIKKIMEMHRIKKIFLYFLIV